MRRHGFISIPKEVALLSFSRPEELKRFLFENMKTSGLHPALGTCCWCYTKTLNPGGYGIKTVDGKVYLVHRISKAVFHGFDISSALHILHKCDNPPCFNPDHLFIGTMRDNMLDKNRKGRGKNVKGEMHYKAKLNNNKVSEIREMRAVGVKVKIIADLFSINESSVSAICKRRTWRHIK